MQFQTLAGNGSQVYTETNGSFDAILFGITATTPANLTLTVLQGIRINVTLLRQSGTTQILTGQVLPIALSSNTGSAQGYVTNDYVGLTAAFGGIVNLQPGDKMQVNVSVTGAATGQVVTFGSRPATGIEYYVPVVTTYSVETNRADQSVSLGSNITGIGLVSVGTDDLVTQIQGSSNIWDCIYNVPLLRAIMTSQFPAGLQVDPVNQALFYSGPEMDNVNLQLSVDTGVSTATWIVAYGGKRTVDATANAQALAQKIAKARFSRYGV